MTDVLSSIHKSWLIALIFDIIIHADVGWAMNEVKKCNVEI